MKKTNRFLTATLAGALVVAPAYDYTGRTEAQRVDRVPTPSLSWQSCFEIAECATVRLPLDYDRPHGATTGVAVLRIKATDQAHKIGSLFLNPGGPGGSGTQFALEAPQFLSDSLLRRFDIVGIDPRGIGSSDNVSCFASPEDEAAVLAKIDVAFPVGKAQEQTYEQGSREFGRACSTTGRPLSGAMSTAEDARDMDVIRRAVGDPKLNYLGFSYGTALGQYYANMFPDRFRVLAVDGVIDPQGWVGNSRQILDARMHSADGAYRAFHEIMVRCGQAGPSRCAFAGGEDPLKKFDEIARSLLRKPIVFQGQTLTYADFVGGVQSILYDSAAGDELTQILAQVWDALHGGSTTVSKVRVNTAGFGPESALSVICTDTWEPADAAFWASATAQRDREVPYFGRSWGWITSPCARDTWTVRDEDAYNGPFNKRTASPMLYVGSLWDPATNYDAAVAASRLHPNARLLSSNNWGHTAYGTGACATTAIDNYLLSGALPPKGTLCTDAPQPFTPILTFNRGKELPPVAAIRPKSILTSGT
jgi:pimeloyl-ACP methyl ester carboxylesterase